LIVLPDTGHAHDALMVARPEELEGLRESSAGRISKLLARFWARRDVEAGKPAGARVTEHFRRLEYAETNFRTRSRRPAGSVSMDALMANRITGAPGFYDELTHHRLTSDSSLLSDRNRIRPSGSLDGRGVAYVRHGPPDGRAGYWWLYNRNGRSYMVTVTSDQDKWPGTRCNLMPRYCAPEMGVRIGPSKRRRWELEEAEWAATIASSDGWRPRYGRELTPSVQIIGVAGLTADSRILVVMAFPGDRLIALDSLSGDSVRYRIRLQVAALGEDGRRFDVDTVRTFTAPTRLSKRQHLQLLQPLSVPPGRYQVTVVAEQGKGDPAAVSGFAVAVEAPAGTALSLSGVAAPDPVATSLDVSDLVPARETGGLPWWNGERTVRLNPLSVTPADVPLQLYFEVAGLAAGQSYDVSLEIRPRGRGPVPATLEFSEVAPAPYFTRSILVPHLRPGVYDATVAVSVPGENRIVRRSTVFTIGKD